MTEIAALARAEDIRGTRAAKFRPEVEALVRPKGSLWSVKNAIVTQTESLYSV
jgi:hypothetical protein